LLCTKERVFLFFRWSAKMYMHSFAGQQKCLYTLSLVSENVCTLFRWSGKMFAHSFADVL
jgi:hypothetical protein